MRLALAQINAVVGDLDGNRERILAALAEARDESADIVLLPELAVTGYPPEDLLLRPAFVRAAEESAARDRGGDGRDRSRSSARRGRSTTASRTRAPSASTASSARSTASAFSPTTASSTRSATSSRARTRSCCRSARPRSAPTVCEDVWQPGPPPPTSPRRRRAPRQPLGVPVPRRQGGEPRGDAGDASPRQRPPTRLLQPRRRPGRALFDGSSAGRRGRGARTRPASRRRCSSSTRPSEVVATRARLSHASTSSSSSSGGRG